MERIRTKIPEPQDATAVDVKEATRKLKLTKYMDNFYCTLFTVSAQEPHHISREVEDKMVRVFKQIDRIYSTLSHDKRKSFVSYYYIILKLLELMKKIELPPKDPLIRTRVRLRQHDHSWKRICEELGWTLKPTELDYVRTSSKPRLQEQSSDKGNGKPIDSTIFTSDFVW